MEYEAAVKKVAELMKETRTCMFTTTNQNGQLTSRPMGVQQIEFDGDAWFFTEKSSDKIAELQSNPQVNVSFASGSAWVSLSGKAEMVDDKQKAEELWSPILKAWFPDGLEDPNLTLIKVHAESAEYWDSDNKLISLFSMAKAALTGQKPNEGENETVKLT